MAVGKNVIILTVYIECCRTECSEVNGQYEVTSRIANGDIITTVHSLQSEARTVLRPARRLWLFPHILLIAVVSVRMFVHLLS